MLRKLLAASAAALVLAPGLARATATVRVEWVRLAAPNFVAGAASNQLAELDAAPAPQSVTGTGAPITFTAPSFGLSGADVGIGFARITVLAGAVDCAWGAGASPASKGARYDSSQGVQLVQVASQTTLSCVEDTTLAWPQGPLSSANGGSTVSTALTFQQLLASNASRKGCLFQNTSTDVEYVYVGATGSATVAKSYKVNPNGIFDCAHGGVVVTDNLAVTSATLNGAAFALVSQ